jgi:hypothetical protein
VRWAVLLAVAASGAGWVGLRDWSLPAPAERERAAAVAVVRVACGPGCHAAAVRRAPSGDWIVRLRGRAATACLLVDPARAAVEPGRGLVGARRVRLAACQD